MCLAAWVIWPLNLSAGVKGDLEPEVSNNTERPDGGRKAGISPGRHSSHFIVSCRSSSKGQDHAFEIQTCGAFYFGLFIFLVALTYAPRSYVTPRASAFEVWVVPLFLAFPGSEREIASLGKLFSSAARGTMVLLFIQRCGTERDGPVRSFSLQNKHMDQCARGSGGERLVGLKVCSPPAWNGLVNKSCLFIKAPFVPLIADPTVILQKNPEAFAFYSSAIKPKSTCRTDSSSANMKTDDFVQRIPFWNI